ncbi:MAG: HNH endonuclease [Candidatus Lokiarchaeota archaeon]|nr:HNH endonuclease [Candidatus Lokiarchaeota archaeon]
MPENNSYEQNKIKCLLWCSRHCCLCDRQCDIDINVHHLIQKSKGGNDDIENLMPLCLNCHSKINSYNKDHPIGNKYNIEELKTRREQIYEKYTHHLVPPIDYKIDGKGRIFPDIGFTIQHLSDWHPVHVRTVIRVYLGGKEIKFDDPSKLYIGEEVWILNPRRIILGHFRLSDEVIESSDRLKIMVWAELIDEYGRLHKYLPEGYVFERIKKYWFLEPHEAIK